MQKPANLKPVGAFPRVGDTVFNPNWNHLRIVVKQTTHTTQAINYQTNKRVKLNHRREWLLTKMDGFDNTLSEHSFRNGQVRVVAS